MSSSVRPSLSPSLPACLPPVSLCLRFSYFAHSILVLTFPSSLLPSLPPPSSGKIYFLLVRIKIKHMELAIIRRESAGTGANVTNESETLCKFEVMDGAPVKGECIPLRLFLSSIDLTPTYRSVNNRFSVRYYLNLVLVDEEDRRYFKQQEVIFYNKDLG
jgi:vacuolar protein sorting-associated protein 26